MDNLARAEAWLQSRDPAHAKPTKWLTDSSRRLPDHSVTSLPLEIADWLTAMVLLKEARLTVGE